eukprot:m.153283 g.153283  ORF g.153283 m.153283 type:complete len:105 (+) comp17910_c0_seq8:1945-2259(+)
MPTCNHTRTQIPQTPHVWNSSSKRATTRCITKDAALVLILKLPTTCVQREIFPYVEHVGANQRRRIALMNTCTFPNGTAQRLFGLGFVSSTSQNAVHNICISAA